MIDIIIYDSWTPPPLIMFQKLSHKGGSCRNGKGGRCHFFITLSSIAFTVYVCVCVCGGGGGGRGVKFVLLHFDSSVF